MAEKDIIISEAEKQAEKQAEAIIIEAEKQAEKQAEALLKATEKKIEKMLKEAQSKLIASPVIIKEGEEKPDLPDYIKEAQAKAMEKVPIMLFRDADKYIDDKFVSVNGERRYQIQRGRQVMVPAFVANVENQSQTQDIHTAELMKKKQSEAEDKF